MFFSAAPRYSSRQQLSWYMLITTRNKPLFLKCIVVEAVLQTVRSFSTFIKLAPALGVLHCVVSVWSRTTEGCESWSQRTLLTSVTESGILFVPVEQEGL